MMDDAPNDGSGTERTNKRTRRQFVAAAGAAGVVGMAGCTGGDDGNDGNGNGGNGNGGNGNGGNGNGGNGDTSDLSYDPGDATMNELSTTEFRGSASYVQGRPAPGGRSMVDLPNLSGELSIYLGGGEGGLYLTLFDFLEQLYPDFSYTTSAKPSSELATQITEEARANQLQADLFVSIGSGSLGTVTEADATRPLSTETVDPVPASFVEPDRNWVGIAGRARAIPYNTDQLSEDDIPDDIMAFPDFEMVNEMGWATTYGAFQDFITTMRLLEGEDATQQWLTDMREAGIQTYPDEFRISAAASTGELTAGFANHYYSQRVLDGAPDRPLALTFTEGDAGSLVNVAGAALLDRDNNPGLADVFVRHLLSAEAQEFFATTTYAYPMIPGVDPVGDLPRIDELDTPDIDLTKLSDTGPTLGLMRDAGVL